MFDFASLPLTEEGRIYHLDLLASELADTIITVGDPKRVDWVSQHFDKIEYQRSHREFKTHTGFIGKKRLSVISTGIGTPNIDIVLNEIDALKNIDFKKRIPKEKKQSVDIIRLGTTGSLQNDIETGDMVVTTAAFGLDGLLHYYQSPQNQREQEIQAAFEAHFPQCPIKPYVFEASKALNEPLLSLGAAGMTVTCIGFYGPQDRALNASLVVDSLVNTCASFEFEQERMLNLEMETAAILGLSRVFGFRATSIAVVLANRQTGDFSRDMQQDVHTMIEKSLEKII